ncbi:hypothetical protein [Kingella kingae]|uniref:hypothetical protein n=1 Tax=Kingella kingae TaxID=504 RepID=UPI000706ABEB|nr:hypothetical protein [Kingella kingae]MDK4539064.1 hypothetical protein [Kingella kingae]CRZ21384.1 protein of unknown function [Kingella kingae]
MPTPLCTSCTRRSLSPCPNLNLIHYNSPKLLNIDIGGLKPTLREQLGYTSMIYL